MRKTSKPAGFSEHTMDAIDLAWLREEEDLARGGPELKRSSLGEDRIVASMAAAPAIDPTIADTVTPVAWLDEFTVNTNTDFQQSDPSVVQLENGEFWISWTDTNPDGTGSPTGSDIIGQRFGVLGNRIGGEVRLNTAFSADDEGNAAMAADVGSNDFFVAFDDGENIRLEHKTSSGGASGSLTIATVIGIQIATDPDIAIATATNGLVVYQTESYNFLNDTFENDIVGQFFDPTTNSLIGGAFNILNEDDISVNADIAVSEGGALGATYVVAFEDEFDGTDKDIVYVPILPNGLSSGVIDVAATTAEETDASITALTGDGFVISWTSSVNNGDILFARYNSDGVKQGSTTTVASGSNIQGKSEVAATDDGGFTVTWQDTTLNRIFMRGFTSTGAAGGTGASAQVDIGLADGDIATLGLGDGRTLVSYGQGDNVRASIFDPRSAVNAPAYTTDTQVGRAGDDVFNVSFGAEQVFGYNGNDTITEVFSAADLISGGNGNDTIVSYLSNFSRTFRGDAGNNTLVLSSGGMPTITFDMFFGTLINNSITSIATSFTNFTYTSAGTVDVSGTSGGNAIAGGDGNDRIAGLGGNDFLEGGEGDDTIIGGAGADDLYGGVGFRDTLSYETSAGNVNVNLATRAVSGGDAEGDFIDGFTDLIGGNGSDVLIGDDQNNALDGGDDNDLIGGGLGDDVLNGNPGNDSLYGEGGADMIDGGAGDDRVGGFTKDDSILGGSGNDTLFGNGDRDTLDGEGGDDVLFGGVDNDTLLGGNGNDELNGAGGLDRLEGGSGDDVLGGRADADRLFGDNGNDTLSGNSNRDTLFGGANDDELRGNNGDDRLLGENGNDALFGGAGADTLVGGAGLDTLAGRADADRFIFEEGDTGASQGTADLITDFSQAEGDAIVLSAIDAITGGGDNAFTFIGEANAFTGTAGELRYRHVDGETRIFGDTDGDGVADFALRLDGTIDLAIGDFVL